MNSPSQTGDIAILDRSRYEPSLEKTRRLIRQFSNVCRAAPVAASQSRTVLSYGDDDATVLLSGERATALTLSMWPSSVCRAAPVAASQSRTVLSYDADATALPSGEKATALTALCGPRASAEQRPSPRPRAGPSYRPTPTPPSYRPVRRLPH